jgi:ribosomal protein S18 acetylase RimI-like enzyme
MISIANADMAFDAAFVRRAPKLAIRAEAAADAPFLHELFVRCSPLRDALPPELLARQGRLQDASHRNAYPAAMRRVVCDEGRCVGRIVIDWTPNDHSHGIDIAVDPAFRATGAGLHLLRAWLDVADALRKPCRLTVMAANPARRLYARLGFVAAQDLYDGQPSIEMARPFGRPPAQN